jgi:primosomal protein N' (replication factor Y)
MTLHRRAAVVACHYCGLKRSYQDDCPSCGSHTLEEIGKGTERIEEALKGLFPNVPMARMDSDTTAVRGSHHRILAAFRSGKTRMLVGTQIVAKGHDFPGVHTAVVVSADHGLRIPDFRSAERTFSLLVQLAGRAGRGTTAGRVFVQTYNPHHYVLESLSEPATFYERELNLRKLLRYPPFSRLVLLRIEGVDRRAVQEEARRIGRNLAALARGYPKVGILGPTLAALPKLVGRWRFQVVIRGEDVAALRAFLEASSASWSHHPRKGIRMKWDVDPRHLM